MADLAGSLIQVVALCEMLLASLERVTEEVESATLREELRKTAEAVRVDLAQLKAEIPEADGPGR